MDLRPVEGAEKEEGAEWIDTSDPMPEAIVPGTPGAPKELGPVVAEEFCAEKPMQFFARRKSFSWGEADWTFSDNAGNLEFEVTGGKFGYVSVKRFLTDAYGNQVLQMQNKVITLFSSIPMNLALYLFLLLFRLGDQLEDGCYYYFGDQFLTYCNSIFEMCSPGR